MVAICCFGALILLHRSFVVSPRNASASVVNGMVGDADIGGDAWERFPNEHSSSPQQLMVRTTCLHGLPNFDPRGADITHLVVLPPSTSGSSQPQRGGRQQQPQRSRVVWKRPTTGSGPQQRVPTTHGDCDAPGQTEELVCEAAAWNGPQGGGDLWLDEQLRGDNVESSLQVYYSYSTTKAYLMLPQGHPMLNQLHVQYVLVSPTDPQCFGEPFLQFLIWKCFVGPDVVLLNWLLTFEDDYDPEHWTYDHASSSSSEQQAEEGAAASDAAGRRRKQGYAYNPRTQRLQELGVDGRGSNKRGIMNNLRESHNNHNHGGTKEPWWRLRFPALLSKLGVLFQTSFLFFFCTTLVSFTLRETQERMLDFTRELSRRVQQSLPVSDLITTHLVQNLVFVPIMVGMMFFLIEFYGGDKYLAFSVSSIVWCAEVFSIISLRSSQGLQYFPKFFFLLFLLFHVYQLAFRETGFVYCALTVVWCFILHSMVFFWHRYELPAVALGHVTVDRPRMVSTASHATGTNGAAPAQRGNRGDASSDTPLDSSTTNRGSSRVRQQHQAREGAAPAATGVTAGRLGTRDAAEAASATPATTTPHDAHYNANSNGREGVPLPSHHSFSTSSSRNVSGLFRNNHDDDSSTGSLLYFMGGEVVVHRSDGTNGGGGGAAQESAFAPAILPAMSRNESGLSLRSLSWEGGGERGNAACGREESGERDCDDPERRSRHDHDDFASVPHAQSMETVPSSNQTPKKRDSGGNPRVHGTEYEQESGGLRAIMESRLTPRHSNAQQADGGRVGAENDGDLGPSASSAAGRPYQRTPPTFPDLPSGSSR